MGPSIGREFVVLLVPLNAAGPHLNERAGAALKLALWLAAYGLCFALLRIWATEWATFGQFSLWFPAAGLRFAFLWSHSPRMVPLAALAELAGGAALGAIDLDMSLAAFLGTIGPCLIYGLVIALLKRSESSLEDDQYFNPLPFAAAAVMGSALAGLSALAWAMPTIEAETPRKIHDIIELLLVFALGDLLGILLIAPPLLALAAFLSSRRSPNLTPIAPSLWMEICSVLSSSWMLVWSLRELGYGLQIAPVVLGTCWAALRGGRLAAWLAILASALIVLPFSDELNAIERMHAHMLLTCIAAGGYVVGSYADAQARAQKAIKRRDRMLFQAERLKTLRAMSLGVIHEINAPLATIALESSSLVSATSGQDIRSDEVRDMAERINRKTNDLSDLIRRLRRFGSNGKEERSCTSAKALVSDAIKLAAPEALAAQVRLDATDVPSAQLEVSDVEVRQALLNMLRNAIEASRDGKSSVTVISHIRNGTLIIDVENHIQHEDLKKPGMRVGLLIAQAIAKAHGGSIGALRTTDGRYRQSFSLPIIDGSDDN